MPEYRIEFKKAAVKALQKMEPQLRKHILNNIQKLASPAPEADIKPLKGYDGLYRLRVGGYRVVYTHDKDGQIIIILVLDVGARGDIYK